MSLLRESPSVLPEVSRFGPLSGSKAWVQSMKTLHGGWRPPAQTQTKEDKQRFGSPNIQTQQGFPPMPSPADDLFRRSSLVKKSVSHYPTTSTYIGCKCKRSESADVDFDVDCTGLNSPEVSPDERNVVSITCCKRGGRRQTSEDEIDKLSNAESVGDAKIFLSGSEEWANASRWLAGRMSSTR